ncbi:MAG: hypothetical protein Tsb0024_01550 [Ruegeria sp.]
MAAKAVLRMPPQMAAEARDPPCTSTINCGMIGMIKPMPIASIITVPNAKRKGSRMPVPIVVFRAEPSEAMPA